MKKYKVAFVDFWQGFKPDGFQLWKSLIAAADCCNLKAVLCSPEDNPDLLVCSVFGKSFRKYALFGQNGNVTAKKTLLWIGENSFPDFNAYDYAIGCQNMSLIENDIQRYQCVPFYWFTGQTDIIRNDAFYNDVDKSVLTDRKMCSCLISNCTNCDPAREALFNAIRVVMPVESGGRAWNNMGSVVPVDKTNEFLGNHCFTLAFENSIEQGYNTEKLINAFQNHTVPIYFGGKRGCMPDIIPGSYIDINDFGTTDTSSRNFYEKTIPTLTDKLIELVSQMKKGNYDEYLKMLTMPKLTLVDSLDIHLNAFLMSVIKGPSFMHKYGRMGLINLTNI